MRELSGPIPVIQLGLHVEVAPDGGCLGHIPSLPGLCFRAISPEELARIGTDRIATYARWLLAEDLARITMVTGIVTTLVRCGDEREIRLIEVERRDGYPLWYSGNPAALFESDLRPLSDAVVSAHLRFTRAVVRHMGILVERLTPVQRMRKPTEGQRSVHETLAHIGNCIWWYCSRIDDSRRAIPMSRGPTRRFAAGRRSTFGSTCRA